MPAARVTITGSLEYPRVLHACYTRVSSCPFTFHFFPFDTGARSKSTRTTRTNSQGFTRARICLPMLLYAAVDTIAVFSSSGPDKFAEIFLGEFDTPEAIWSNEMR